MLPPTPPDPAPPLPPSFWLAVEQFNRAEFFEVHETLETLWRDEPSELRLLYQGFLQIAVGCFHLCTRHNYRGAVKKLEQGARKIELFLPAYGGFDTAHLLEQAEMLHARLVRLGEERLSEYDPAWIETFKL